MYVKRSGDLIFFESRVNMEISSIAYAELDRSWDLKNMRSSFTRIYIPLEGEGKLNCGKESIGILPDNIYVVPSGTTFSACCEERLNKLFVHLIIKLPDGSDAFSGIGHCIVLRDKSELAKELLELFKRTDLISVIKFKNILYRISEEALEAETDRSKPLKRNSREIRDALKYIDSHMSAALTVDHVAQALFLPESTLQRKFKSETGRSVGAYIDTCLDLQAEKYLLDSSMSIKEISQQMGFCDQFYFSRKFKKTHGISPRAFRQKYNI